MLTIRNRNVNGMLEMVAASMTQLGTKESSRNGDVLVLDTPAMSVYARPTERVLLDPARDANPFFHLFESLWMLDGRDDAAFLNRFVRDFGDRFADEGILHGAYGFRWREAFGGDQLVGIVSMLKEDPTTRRAVLQMWSSDLDLGARFKDIPCNTHVYFRVRDQDAVITDLSTLPGPIESSDAKHKVLDVTVCCRSNDVIWGAYGANAVHFSMLQEYVAGAIGVKVGRMYQLSNNWHAYADVLEKYLERRRQMLMAGETHEFGIDPYNPFNNPRRVEPRPIGTSWDRWLTDLRSFMDWASDEENDEPDQSPTQYPENPWFHEVAEPMLVAHHFHKVIGDTHHALEVVTEHVKASDWRAAASDWLKRRMEKKEQAA